MVSEPHSVHLPAEVVSDARTVSELITEVYGSSTAELDSREYLINWAILASTNSEG